MITGKEQGSGTYSYHKRSNSREAVFVSHMPEDSFKVRIVFTHLGETAIPIIKLDEGQAEMLWAALCAMAKDLDWKDYSCENPK